MTTTLNHILTENKLSLDTALQLPAAPGTLGLTIELTGFKKPYFLAFYGDYFGQYPAGSFIGSEKELKQLLDREVAIQDINRKLLGSNFQSLEDRGPSVRKLTKEETKALQNGKGLNLESNQIKPTKAEKDEEFQLPSEKKFADLKNQDEEALVNAVKKFFEDSSFIPGAKLNELRMDDGKKTLTRTYNLGGFLKGLLVNEKLFVYNKEFGIGDKGGSLIITEYKANADVTKSIQIERSLETSKLGLGIAFGSSAMNGGGRVEGNDPDKNEEKNKPEFKSEKGKKGFKKKTPITIGATWMKEHYKFTITASLRGVVNHKIDGEPRVIKFE